MKKAAIIDKKGQMFRFTVGIEGNSIRDNVKDAIRNFLMNRTRPAFTEDVINEWVYELADTVFDALEIHPETQDLPRKRVLIKGV